MDRGTKSERMEPQQEEMLKRIGARIRSERNSLGLSLEALAKKVGVSKMTLQRIETGFTSPSIITLTDLSFHLKQPIETLIKEGEPKVVLLKKVEQNAVFDPESGIRVEEGNHY
jgi:transcriptional regulator with XRE-family HTH domain